MDIGTTINSRSNYKNNLLRVSTVAQLLSSRYTRRNLELAWNDHVWYRRAIVRSLRIDLQHHRRSSRDGGVWRPIIKALFPEATVGDRYRSWLDFFTRTGLPVYLRAKSWTVLDDRTRFVSEYAATSI